MYCSLNVYVSVETVVVYLSRRYLGRRTMSDKKIESGKYKIDMTVAIFIMRGKMFDHQP